MKGAKPANIRAPKARSCYICGRQYMLHSFAIHEAQCRDMFQKWENQKPPKDRRKCPEDPMRGFKPNMSMKELDDLNAASFQTWNEQALVRCQNCNRSFLPEKLPVHQKSCTSMKPARRVDDPISQRDNLSMESSGRFPQAKSNAFIDDIDSVNSNSGNLVQCRNCGRKFNANSYVKHAKVCAKVFCKSRKVFNSAKQRMQGTELEEYNRYGGKKNNSNRRPISSNTSTLSSNPVSLSTLQSINRQGDSSTLKQNGSIPKWKLDSLRFREAMKAARQVSQAEKQAKATGVALHLLLPPTKYNSGGNGIRGVADGFPAEQQQFDGLRCPTCGRTFSQKAGERHIPQCKNIINKPKVLMKGSGAPSYSSPESIKNTSNTKGSFGSSSGTGSYELDRRAKASPRMTVAGFGSGRPPTMSGRTGSFTSQAADRETYLAQGRGRFSTTTSAIAHSGASGAPGAHGTTVHSNSSSRPNSGSLSRTVSGITRGDPSGRVSQSLLASTAGVRTGATSSSFRSTLGGPSSMATPHSSRPSPRVFNSGTVAALSASTTSRRNNTSASTGSAAGYQLSHSNATSKDNPLFSRNHY